jgi:hypothetical protein
MPDIDWSYNDLVSDVQKKAIKRSLSVPLKERVKTFIQSYDKGEVRDMGNAFAKLPKYEGSAGKTFVDSKGNTCAVAPVKMRSVSDKLVRELRRHEGNSYGELSPEVVTERPRSAPVLATPRPNSPFKRCKPNVPVTVERVSRKKLVKL